MSYKNSTFKHHKRIICGNFSVIDYFGTDTNWAVSVFVGYRDG